MCYWNSKRNLFYYFDSCIWASKLSTSCSYLILTSLRSVRISSVLLWAIKQTLNEKNNRKHRMGLVTQAVHVFVQNWVKVSCIPSQQQADVLKMHYQQQHVQDPRRSGPRRQQLTTGNKAPANLLLRFQCRVFISYW